MSIQFRSLCFLGTSSGTPTMARNVSSSCLALSDGRVWMVDCGEGTQHQLLRCPDISLSKIDTIFVTHMHGDHIFGLPGMMCTISLLWQPPGLQSKVENECDVSFDRFSASSEFLEIVGPPQLGHYLRTVLAVSGSQFGFRYRVTELMLPSFNDRSPPPSLHPCEAPPRCLHPDSRGVWQVDGKQDDVVVAAAPLDHRVPCVGYSFREPDCPGTLNARRAQLLGVPSGPLLGQLKRGLSVTTESGDEVHPSDVLGPKIDGRTLVVLGDTCDSQAAVPIATRADWLVHEATFDDSNAALAKPKGHSTSRMAGKFAATVGAQHLILTHFSARFPPAEKDPGPVACLVEQARKEFDGEVIAAHDFFQLDLQRKRK